MLPIRFARGDSRSRSGKVYGEYPSRRDSFDVGRSRADAARRPRASDPARTSATTVPGQLLGRTRFLGRAGGGEPDRSPRRASSCPCRSPCESRMPRWLRRRRGRNASFATSTCTIGRYVRSATRSSGLDPCQPACFGATASFIRPTRSSNSRCCGWPAGGGCSPGSAATSCSRAGAGGISPISSPGEGVRSSAMPAGSPTPRHPRARDGDGTTGASDFATCRGCVPRRSRAASKLATSAHAEQPRSWRRWIDWLLRRRSLCAARWSLSLVAADAGALVSHPLLDPTFLAAVARRGGHLGFGDRTGVMRAIFDGALPDAVLARATKARLRRGLLGRGHPRVRARVGRGRHRWRAHRSGCAAQGMAEAESARRERDAPARGLAERAELGADPRQVPAGRRSISGNNGFRHV